MNNCKIKLLFFCFFLLVRNQVFCQNNVIEMLANCPPQDYHPAPYDYRNSKLGCDKYLSLPSYLWSYGCWPTSAAMLLGFYDREGYSCCYNGSINGGLAPFTTGKTFPQVTSVNYILYNNPMSASIKGLDGRTTNGHVDDFWTSLNSTGDSHPWIVNTPPHDFTISPCAADYGGTSQDYWNNFDSGTGIYLDLSGAKLNDFTGLENSTPRKRDGLHGLRLLFEGLGYRVLENYNQYIKGQAPNSSTAGFTFDEYKAEIDAGRPVLLHLKSVGTTGGHTMVGHGYITCNGQQTIVLVDTWNDYSTQMVWGGTYDGRQLYAVSVFKLEPLSKSSGVCTAPVGIHDIVEIMNPPSSSPFPPNTLNFSLGTTASFYAKFTSYEGNTYPTSWSWSMDLYHAGGAYTISSDNFSVGLSDFHWAPTVSTALPNYDWILDETGNISGKVTVTVHINDGDYKSDEVRVSVINAVNCIKNIENILYTSNATIAGCEIKLKNVTIQNNANVVFDSETETTITGTFEVAIGSTLEIK